ncbi:lytic transglycosylase domain-containing protein [Pseudomonas sp. LFM046]|uniref:lytic transglycosylase domain-containing protein n=1 Tax=Pseudomonas sp. LFM046 TaxID=1608357 RepID=UPI0005CFA126|nr:lytic transglycosylase domain-containing protein [Pseudomonas sp. LFM046]
MMKVPALVLFSIVATGAVSAQADIYQVTSVDGHITLTNVHRSVHKGVRPHREAPMLAWAPNVMKPRVRRPYTALNKPPHKSAPRYALIVAQAAFEYDLPTELLHAMIKTESNYDPKAVSPMGAAGLMQLMPKTARHLGVRDVFDPVANVRGGARYIKSLMDMFDNNLTLALAAYNAGPGTVLAYGRAIPPNPETQRYVPSVLGHYKRLLADAKRPR